MNWDSVLKTLFINFCVLITLMFFVSLTFGPPRRWSRWLRFVLLAGGGLLLMSFAVHLPNGTLLDLRKVPLLLAVLLGGPWEALLVALPIAAYPLWLGGPVAPLGLLSLALIWLVGVGLRRYVPAARLREGRAWWCYALAFLSTDLILLLVPRTHPAAQLGHIALLTVFETLGLLGALAVLSVRLRANERLASYRDQAYRDALTGLHNRRQFDEDLAQLRRDGRTQLIMLDIDHFKRINDTHGHDFGDEVLRRLGSLLTLHMPAQGRAYRLGGEEFAVPLHGADGLTAARLADRLRDLAAARLSILTGPAAPVTLSAGCAAFEGDGTRMLSLADTRLYDAKRGGRNRTVFDRSDTLPPEQAAH